MSYSQANIELIAFLFRAHPPAVGTADEQGRLPLHDAAAWQAGMEVVGLLMSAHKDAVRTPDKRGCLPLHYAVACEAELQVVTALLEAFPAALNIQGHGRLPLQFALEEDAAPRVVALLGAHMKTAAPGRKKKKK